MTRINSPRAAMKIIPGWDADAAEIEELHGGLTNRSYLVRQHGRHCVLRIDSAEAPAIPLARTCEVVAQGNACRAGLAPGIIFSDVDAGILVTEYLPGRVWTDTDLHTSTGLEALAKLLNRVHALPLCGARMDAAKAAGNYQRFIARRQGLQAFASRCAEIASGITPREQVVCCHNDIVAGNIIGDESPMLIDWEFAADNDPLFDLASAIGFHNLDARRSAMLLNAYAGGVSAELQEQLAEQLRLYDAIQWLWLAARQLVLPSRPQLRRLEQLQQRIR